MSVDEHVYDVLIVGGGPAGMAAASTASNAGLSTVLIDERPAVESATTTLKVQKGSFKFGGLSLGGLLADEQTDRDGSLAWYPAIIPPLAVGDELVVADLEWFTTFKAGDQLAIERPEVDAVSAPTKLCDEHTYADDPDRHKYCCRPHEIVEADTADWLAERRARGELNPETWPPVVDEDQFDVPARGSRTAEDDDADIGHPDQDLTIDDLD